MTTSACMTPLIDLLRGVPKDACLMYEHGPTHHQNIPVGRLCGEAADEIARLRAWIKHEGEVADTCTFSALNEICEGCMCARAIT